MSKSGNGPYCICRAVEEYFAHASSKIASYIKEVLAPRPYLENPSDFANSVRGQTVGELPWNRDVYIFISGQFQVMVKCMQLASKSNSTFISRVLSLANTLVMMQTRELVALACSLFNIISLKCAVAAMPETTNAEEYGLNDAAKARGKLYFGTATEPSKFLKDAAYYKQLNNTHDFGQFVPEASMKWDQTEPERDTFDFSVGDQIVDLAAANGQIVRCHNLLWHLSTPDWVVNGGFDNATLISIIENHVTKVVEHYKGRCYAWDVINEGS